MASSRGWEEPYDKVTTASLVEIFRPRAYDDLVDGKLDVSAAVDDEVTVFLFTAQFCHRIDERT